jgi:hypothetical protein
MSETLTPRTLLLLLLHPRQQQQMLLLQCRPTRPEGNQQ